MKRLFLVLAVLALPALVSAQANDVCVGATCYTPTADEIAAQVYKRDQHNTQVCTGVGLPSSCTQAEYDAHECTPGVPGSCPAATVYTNNAQGVRDYFLDKLKADIAASVSTQRAEHKNRARVAWDEASQAERDAACVALGKAADCT